MKHQGRRLDLRQQGRTSTVSHHRQHLAQGADRVEASVGGLRDALAQFSLRGLKTRAANDPEQPHIVVHHRLPVKP